MFGTQPAEMKDGLNARNGLLEFFLLSCKVAYGYWGTFWGREMWSFGFVLVD